VAFASIASEMGDVCPTEELSSLGSVSSIV